MATIRQRMIRVPQPVATCRRSHLSPDGGSFTRHAPPLGSGWLRFDSRGFAFPAVATCRRSHLSPDGGSFTRTPTTAWQRMATAWQRMATIRQSTRVGQTLDRAWLVNQNCRFARNKRRSDHLPVIPQVRTANNLYLCTAIRIRPGNAGSLCSNS